MSQISLEQHPKGHCTSSHAIYKCSDKQLKLEGTTILWTKEACGHRKWSIKDASRKFKISHSDALPSIANALQKVSHTTGMKQRIHEIQDLDPKNPWSLLWPWPPAFCPVERQSTPLLQLFAPSCKGFLSWPPTLLQRTAVRALKSHGQSRNSDVLGIAHSTSLS